MRASDVVMLFGAFCPFAEYEFGYSTLWGGRDVATEGSAYSKRASRRTGEVLTQSSRIPQLRVGGADRSGQRPPVVLTTE